MDTFIISKCELKASRPAWEIYSQSEESAKIIASVLRPSLPLSPSVRRDCHPRSLASSAAVDIFGLWPGAAISLLLFLSLAVAIAKVDASLAIRAHWRSLVGQCLG